jgi:hypothetical protein
VRGLAVSVVIALSITGAALGTGWGVQAGVLPRSPRVDHVTADAAAWLLRYRIVAASLRIDGHRESSLCLHSWFRRNDGTLARGSLVVLGDGTRIADSGHHVTVIEPGDSRALHLPLVLELAGCPSVLGARTATAAVNGGIGISRGFAAGRPALALRLPARTDRLGPRRHLSDRATLYVSLRTYRPLAVSASLGALRGVARLRLVRATPSLLARFATANARVPGTRP